LENMKITTLALEGRYPVDLAEEARVLLRRLPPEHLIGISRITVSGTRPLDEVAGADVLGQYFEAYDGEPAFIMIYPEEMSREVPLLLRPFAVVWRVLLAETLYHEIGHHYQRFTHGIRKPAQENHAETYGLRHARAAFPRVYRLLDLWERARSRVRRTRLWWLERRRALGRLAAPGLYELGRLHWEEDDWSRVVSVWEEALALDPGFSPAREWLPRARRRLRAQARRHAAPGGLRNRVQRRPARSGRRGR
jgi:hypothetical protein